MLFFWTLQDLQATNLPSSLPAYKHWHHRRKFRKQFTHRTQNMLQNLWKKHNIKILYLINWSKKDWSIIRKNCKIQHRVIPWESQDERVKLEWLSFYRYQGKANIIKFGFMLEVIPLSEYFQLLRFILLLNLLLKIESWYKIVKLHS